MQSKVDPIVRKETVWIGTCVLIGSMLMQAVFLILRRWDMTVLLGNLLGAALAVGNFFLMALTVQKSLEMEPADAKKRMQFSHSMRMLMLVVGCAIGAAVPCFHLIAVLVPLLMPRIGVGIRGALIKKEEKQPNDEA